MSERDTRMRDIPVGVIGDSVDWITRLPIGIDEEVVVVFVAMNEVVVVMEVVREVVNEVVREVVVVSEVVEVSTVLLVIVVDETGGFGMAPPCSNKLTPPMTPAATRTPITAMIRGKLAFIKSWALLRAYLHNLAFQLSV